MGYALNPTECLLLCLSGMPPIAPPAVGTPGVLRQEAVSTADGTLQRKSWRMGLGWCTPCMFMVPFADSSATCAVAVAILLHLLHACCGAPG